MNLTSTRPVIVLLLVTLAVSAGPVAWADVVTDWDATVCDLVAQAKLNPAAANRVVTIVQTAVYEAANAVTRRYPPVRCGWRPRPGHRSRPPSRRRTAPRSPVLSRRSKQR